MAKSDLQKVLDNIPRLKKRNRHFIAYLSTIELDDTLFKVEYTAYQVLTLKKAGRGRHPEFTIRFDDRTVKLHRKGFGLTSYSFSGELDIDDYLIAIDESDKHAYQLIQRAPKHEHLMVINLITNKEEILTNEAFNARFKTDNQQAIEIIYGDYLIRRHAIRRETNVFMRQEMEKSAKKLFTHVAKLRDILKYH